MSFIQDISATYPTIRLTPATDGGEPVCLHIARDCAGMLISEDEHLPRPGLDQIT